VTLGTLTPDSTGHISGSFSVPTLVPPGNHLLVLSGPGPDGKTRTVSTPLTVTAAGSTGTGSGGTSGSTGTGSAAGTGSGSSSTSGSGLANTGVQTRLFVLGATLMMVGSLLVVTARRRRLRSWS
jgi:hypothetical protein